jgi:hypothetical protein
MRMIAGGLITLSGAILWAAGAIAHATRGTDEDVLLLIFGVVGFGLGFVGLSMALYGERPPQ